MRKERRFAREEGAEEEGAEEEREREGKEKEKGKNRSTVGDGWQR